MKILSVVGARPNFMKIAPFVRAIQRRCEGSKQDTQHILVHTGQHYDLNMSDSFFSELGIPQPDINLGVGSGSHGYQIGQTMIEFEKALLAEQPDWVVVVGDVNATAACSIVARKHGVKVAHIEAGLRSFDWTMPEEINRVVTDRLSNLLLTTDRLADENLRREGASEESIARVGNIMIDTLEYERPKAESLNIGEIIDVNRLDNGGFPARSTGSQGNSSLGSFGFVTLHRPSNVDSPEVMKGLMGVLKKIAAQLPLIFPAHPRTVARMKEFGVLGQSANADNLILTQPIGYRELLCLNMKATVALTDSGGIQEEATVLGTPCLTLRWNTERPITLMEQGGTNRLVGNDPDVIWSAFCRAVEEPRRPQRPELWDGHTADRIVARLLQGGR